MKIPGEDPARFYQLMTKVFHLIVCTRLFVWGPGIIINLRIGKKFRGDDDMDITNTTNELTVVSFYNQQVLKYPPGLPSWK